MDGDLDGDLNARSDDLSPAWQDEESPTKVARHLALEREKQSLRRERDQLLVDLGRRLGRARLARLLDVGEADVGRLIERARERLYANASYGEGGRLPDAHAPYPALGFRRRLAR